MSSHELNSLAERKQAAVDLLRSKPERMTDDELDWAMALLLQAPLRVTRRATGWLIEVPHPPSAWRPFSPTRDWANYGEVVTQVELVTGTHLEYDDPADLQRVTGRWFSCHAFVSGTSVDGRDLRRTVGQSCAMRLAHEIEYGDAWQER